MVDRGQNSQNWRPFQPAPQSQGPWMGTNGQEGMLQPPRGPPMSGSSMQTPARPVIPFRPVMPGQQPPVPGMPSPVPFIPSQRPAMPMTQSGGQQSFAPGMTSPIPTIPSQRPTMPVAQTMAQQSFAPGMASQRPLMTPRPLQPIMQRPFQGPSSAGVPGMRPPGNVQPIYQPPSVPTFNPSLNHPTSPVPPSLSHEHASFAPTPPHTGSWGVEKQVLDQFEILTLGPSAPGARDQMDDARSLPRPNGIIPSVSETFPQNAHHDFIRMTTSYAPRSASLRDRFHLPFGAIIQPLAETAQTPSVPLIKLGTHGIVRCRRCRTYVNPFVHWSDGGRRWQCNMCNALNDTPRDFYCSLENDGTRSDAQSRPELSTGSVEFVAPPEYMVRGPMPAVYLFVVDVSFPQSAVDVITSLSASILAALDKLQGDDRKRIGFLTFDRTLHFYNLKDSDQAKMYVVPEIDDPFLPHPDDMLINVEEGRSKIEAFLESWPSNFNPSSPNQPSAMGAALQVAFMLLNQTGGKMELFLSSPPSLGSGAVRNRDNPSLYNSDREMNLRNPEDSFYKRFAAECSRVHICIDIFSFCGQFTDLASLACLARYTGGQLYRYPGFISKRDGGRLRYDIIRNLTRYTAWEGVMRLRCSKGLRITSFCGHFFIRSSDLLALPTCDPDKGFAVEIKHEDTVLDGNRGCIQCALLYTASCGERRIRVHTLQFAVSHELADLYRKADAAALTTLIAKFGIDETYSSKLAMVQKSIEGKLISGFREYRIMHSRNFTGLNKLIYPDSLRWLPLWILALLKTNALRGNGGEVPTDDRIASGFELMATTLDRILHILCPTLYVITNITKYPKNELPLVAPCAFEFLSPNEVYVLDTSRLIFLLFGSSVPLEYLGQLTGVAPQALKTTPLHALRIEPPQKNELSQRVCSFIESIRERRRGYQPVVLLQLGTDQEQHLLPFFIEDKKHSMRSYHDFIMTLYRQIGGK